MLNGQYLFFVLEKRKSELVVSLCQNKDVNNSNYCGANKFQAQLSLCLLIDEL